MHSQLFFKLAFKVQLSEGPSNGLLFTFLLISGVLYFTLLCLADSISVYVKYQGILRNASVRLRRKKEMTEAEEFGESYHFHEDRDVQIEKDRLKDLYGDDPKSPVVIQRGEDTSYPPAEQNQPSKDVLLLKGLRRVFKTTFCTTQSPVVAVENLWFGVPQGQCFG